MRRYKSEREYIAHQNNNRGMGLARDVKAGQANPVRGQSGKRRRRYKPPRSYQNA